MRRMYEARDPRVRFNERHGDLRFLPLLSATFFDWTPPVSSDFFCDFHRVGYLLLSHCQNLPFSIALCSPLHLLRMSTWPGGFRTSILFFPSHLHSLVFNIETCYRVISAFFNQLTCLNVSQTSFKHVWDLNFILAWVH